MHLSSNTKSGILNRNQSIIILHRTPQTMAQVHFSSLTDRWNGEANHDAFCTEKIGKYQIFGVAEGLSDLPGSSSASGIAISSLRESVKSRNVPPETILEAAVHDAEARIEMNARRTQGMGRDAAHLSACLLEDTLDCTILD